MIKTKHGRRMQLIYNFLLILLCAAIIFPFVLVVSISLSNEADIAAYGYSVLPRKLDFSAYTFIFENPGAILNAYQITFVFSVVSMVLGVLLMALIAYPLTQKDFKAKGGISFYLYFTMLFSGGLVPSYILITRYLHLEDNLLVYILPGLISPWYVFMMRTFFAGIPKELSESAYIDGANEFTIFFRIILPLSKPVLATVALFVFLAKWNDWYTAMLYINEERLISLQYMLQRIMLNIQLLQNSSMNQSDLIDISKIPTETVRMAMAVVVAGPALVVFPFFQKYFVKGLTVGSVKG